MDSVLLGLLKRWARRRTGARERVAAFGLDRTVCKHLGAARYREAHRRGEVIVAAVMRAFLDVGRVALRH
jgi:hypothetical protein